MLSTVYSNIHITNLPMFPPTSNKCIRSFDSASPSSSSPLAALKDETHTTDSVNETLMSQFVYLLPLCPVVCKSQTKFISLWFSLLLFQCQVSCLWSCLGPTKHCCNWILHTTVRKRVLLTVHSQFVFGYSLALSEIILPSPFQWDKLVLGIIWCWK